MLKRFFASALLFAASLTAQYALGPDSQRHEGVPHGAVTKFTWTSNGGMYPGIQRDYWVYVPPQYSAGKPAALMVFQDGAGGIREDGDFRVPLVFDNLIQHGVMPVTIGVFINPGVLPQGSNDLPPLFNRSFEYDSVDDRYARFLTEEVLPEIKKQWNISDDPNQHAIAGASSALSAATPISAAGINGPIWCGKWSLPHFAYFCRTAITT
jgi:enterochelin esterase family protein